MELKAVITKKGAIFEGKAPEIINNELTAAMYEALALIERNVKRFTPVGVFGAQGGLLGSEHGEVIGKGTPLVKGVFASQSPYGEVIEKGRTAGKTWPPQGALLAWIAKKNILPREVGSIHEAVMWTRRSKQSGGAWSKRVSSIGEAVQVARAQKSLEFVLRRKIGEKGFEGVHMFEKGFEASLPGLDEIFDRHGFNIARKLDE